MSNFSGVSRHRFRATVGTINAAILFEGRFGNPPLADLFPGAEGLTLSSATTPEVTRIKLGHTEIAESALLILAKEKSFSDRCGISAVAASVR